MKRSFIDLENGKYYKLYMGGYDGVRVGRIECRNDKDHCIYSTGEQVARTFMFTQPNDKSIHRFGSYVWDYGYTPGTIYPEGRGPENHSTFQQGIYCAEELSIITDQEYYDYCEANSINIPRWR